MKYCHTHGACNHLSYKCRSKAEGHKDKAPFQHRMGGSTKKIKAWLLEPRIPLHLHNSKDNKSVTNYSNFNVSSVAPTTQQKMSVSKQIQAQQNIIFVCKIQQI